MKVYPNPVHALGRESRSGLLNEAMLAMVKRAFEMLDQEGLSFAGLPSSFQELDALEMLDALALAAHEAIEHHATRLPPESLVGLQAAVDMLWQASAVSSKMRQMAAGTSQPTLNDMAEVALLAATAGESIGGATNGMMGDRHSQATRQRQIDNARAARTSRSRAQWERTIFQHCQERLAELPTLDSKNLAITVCARNGIQITRRPHVEALIEHWRRNGALQPPGSRAG